MTMQLALFQSFPYITVIPSSLGPIELGPAPIYCRECHDETNLTFVNNEWHCENEQECRGCHYFSHDYVCETCNCCSDGCCECHWCTVCETSILPRHYLCRYGDHCDDCCTCCGECEQPSSECTCCGECEQPSSECECGCPDEDYSTYSGSTPDGAGKHLIGIEIEFCGDRNAISRAIRYSHLPGWDVVEDGSYGVDGELRSPPMDWDTDDAKEQLVTACAVLRTNGATTGTGCGVHVHVDARDLNAKQVANIALWGHDYEDQLYRVGSSGWRTIREGIRNYAQPISATMADDLVKVDNERCTLNIAVYGSDRARTSHYDSARYRLVNVHPWTSNDKGTVEFRVFNSSLNSYRIMGYVSLCNAVVEASRQGQLARPKVRYGLGGMAEGTVGEAIAYVDMISSLYILTRLELECLAWIWSDSCPQVVAV